MLAQTPRTEHTGISMVREIHEWKYYSITITLFWCYGYWLEILRVLGKGRTREWSGIFYGKDGAAE